MAGELRGRPRDLERRVDRAALRRLVRVPRPRRAVGAAVLPGAAPRSSSRSRARCARPPSEGLIADFAPEWVEFLRASCRSRRSSSTGCGSRWRPPRATACRTRWRRACACRPRQAALGAGDRALRDGPRAPPRLRVPDRRRARRVPARRARGSRRGATSSGWPPRADWGEVIVAANLCFEPIVGTLIRRELGTRAAAANGDTVTPVLARVATQEWEWARAWTVALVRFLLADEAHGAAQPRAIVDGWLRRLDGAAARERRGGGVRRRAGRSGDVRAGATRARRAGLPSGGSSESRGGDAAPRRRRAAAPARRSASPRAGRGDRRRRRRRRTYDYVGIVMAKSAEGDAVAAILRRRDGIEVIEQPAFWEIRARDRLVDPLRRRLRGARLRDRRLLDPARDVDPLRPDGRHRRRADAVRRSRPRRWST